MEPAPGCIRRSLHRIIRRSTRRIDHWSAAIDRLVDIHPTAILGLGLGLVRLMIGLLSETSSMTPKPPASPGSGE